MTATWWQKFGTVGQIAQAVVASLGFVAVLFQINVLARNAEQSGARQVYQAYNDLEFRNPQFSKPDLQRIKAAPESEIVQYETFVSYFLYACEEVMKAFADKSEWRATCRYDLKHHLQFLCEKSAREPGYMKTYSNATQTWIAEEMQQAGLAAPACQPRTT